MNRVVGANTDRTIHVILDNLNTHRPKDDRWLRRHQNVHFHFTPTKASWLNQVEIWFSIPHRKGAFRSVRYVIQSKVPCIVEVHIDYIQLL
jgi:transposase